MIELPCEEKQCFFTKLILPQIVDFDNSKIVLQLSEKIELELNEKWASATARLQGVFETLEGKLVEIRSVGLNQTGNPHDLDILLFSCPSYHELNVPIKIGKFSIRENLERFAAYAGNLTHREIVKEFRRKGIASYVLNKMERHLKQVGKEKIVVGADEDLPSVKNFLIANDFKLSKKEKIIGAKYAFEKELTEVQTDETDDMQTYSKFPVKSNGKTMHLVAKMGVG